MNGNSKKNVNVHENIIILNVLLNLLLFVLSVLPSNYMIDIDVRFFDLFLVDYLRNLVRNISLPLTLRNSINITDIDMTTGEIRMFHHVTH